MKQTYLEKNEENMNQTYIEKNEENQMSKNNMLEVEYE
jgi:hypothetical protein